MVCPDLDQPIGWHCSHCGVDGTISNWAGSIYDLRRRQLTAAQPRRDILIDADTAAILRTLPFLNNDCQIRERFRDLRPRVDCDVVA